MSNTELHFLVREYLAETDKSKADELLERIFKAYDERQQLLSN